MSLGNLGDLGNLDLGQLQQYLPNINFPASKEEVASTAQSNDAPQEVVDRIRNSGKDTFNSADEVLQAVQGKLEAHHGTSISLRPGHQCPGTFLAP
jgi:Protein of unknown function (DUF2795)